MTDVVQAAAERSETPPDCKSSMSPVDSNEKQELESCNEAVESIVQETSESLLYTPPTFDIQPSMIYSESFSSFTKGIKWSKEGSKFAIVTDDNTLQIRSTLDCQASSVLLNKIDVEKLWSVREPQPIHDFAWHPSVDRSALVTTCNTQPLHLYEGSSGRFLCSYVARNHLDEHISAYSLQFTRGGERICAGFKKFIRVFDVEKPGVWSEISTWQLGQAGIVSAIDTNGDNIIAAGTYCNSVALYELRSGKAIHAPEEGHNGGITQVRFSHDGQLLYSGARKDSAILCRDIRNFSSILYEFPRKCETNQRVHFDLPYEENYICTGNTDGSCFLWNIRELKIYGDNKCRPNLVFLPHSNVSLTESSATNGVSFHPWCPVIATSSGGRRKNHWDDNKEAIVWQEPYENSVKIWNFQV